MTVDIVNGGLLNIIEPFGYKESDVDKVSLGESTIIVYLKNKRVIVKGYVYDGYEQYYN